MKTKKQLQEIMAKALQAANEIRDAWSKANPTAGVMDTDHVERFDKAMADFDNAETELKQIERLEKANLLVAEISDMVPGVGKSNLSDTEKQADEAYAKAFDSFLRKGEKGMTRTEIEVLKGGAAKAYETGNDPQGGFFITQQMSNQILTLIKDDTVIRDLSTVVPINGSDSLGVVGIDTDPSDADWTAEVGTVQEETTLRAGKRELRPHLLSKLIKMSTRLVRVAPNFAAIAMDRVAYKHAIAEEKAFMTGTGVHQPLGIFTADNSGISTGRDATTAGAGVIAGDDIIDTFYNVKGGYQANGTWVLSRSTLKTIRKLKYTVTGEYVWTAGFGGAPPTLYDRPYRISEYAPTYSASAGTYLAVFGDFRNYWIADGLNMSIQVLNELYAATNQVGYILRRESDGMPVQEEAFSRMKMQ